MVGDGGTNKKTKVGAGGGVEDVKFFIGNDGQD